MLHLEHNFVGMESVLWCVAFYHFFFPIYPFFFPKSEKSSIRTHFQKMRIFQGFEGKKPCIMRFLPRIKLPEVLTKPPNFCKMVKRLEMLCSQKEPRVRIPNSPPKTQSYQGFCPYDWAFLFSQGHIGVHDFRQELRCASRSALCPAESGYCPLHLPR